MWFSAKWDVLPRGLCKFYFVFSRLACKTMDAVCDKREWTMSFCRNKEFVSNILVD